MFYCFRMYSAERLQCQLYFKPSPKPLNHQFARSVSFFPPPSRSKTAGAHTKVRAAPPASRLAAHSSPQHPQHPWRMNVDPSPSSPSRTATSTSTQPSTKQDASVSLSSLSFAHPSSTQSQPPIVRMLICTIRPPSNQLALSPVTRDYSFEASWRGECQ